MEKSTLAGGCFWCTEAIFKRLKGVLDVHSGYSGGTVANPTYEDVCSGKTGHAETIQVIFDPNIISYEKLLDVFWHLHNPTTKNRQGPDEGTQYRSVIFYHSDWQKEIAKKSKEAIEKASLYKAPIVTEIVPFTNFYEAEPHHQNYYDRNSSVPYCQYIIDPKIQKLTQEFREDIKEDKMH
ncbi:MAG: peptide-methionine (S)-S-oxide reductase MsrA [Candidatus Levybacteria bacterium]|nr:peptide-methionine (S)-S-oxide reductase MsrA [Candidatus Levybacteria bacterium]